MKFGPEILPGYWISLMDFRIMDMSRVGHGSLGCLWGCLWVSVHPPGVVDVVLSNAMSKHYIFVEIYFLSDRFKSMLSAQLLRVES
jgi:hypothetical protein